MSLVPRWFSRLPRQKGEGAELFNLGSFIEELERELTTANLSGLSVSSDEKNIYIEAQVPGLTSKDIDVSIDSNNMLWIRGERKEEETNKDKQYYRKSQNSFSYCVPLWEEVDISIEPEAVCKDGVMKITFAKKKESKIEVKKLKVKD